VKHRLARPRRPWSRWLRTGAIAVAASSSAVVLAASAHGTFEPAAEAPARTDDAARLAGSSAQQGSVVARVEPALRAHASSRSPRAELDAARRSAAGRPSRGDDRRPAREVDSRSNVREVDSRSNVLEVPRWLRGCLTGPAHSAKEHANGQIPAADLCRLPRGDHLLHGDAALAWWKLDRAFARRFGAGMCMTDSYRSYEAQEQVYALKPGLAAVPGTSSHGWGLALDLCGGIESYDSAAHQWLSLHGPRWGWTNPPWARISGSLPEPWHWEYVGTAGRRSTAPSDGNGTGSAE
jgi:zinc D-Ala-D-Ala carboxypeptidase